MTNPLVNFIILSSFFQVEKMLLEFPNTLTFYKSSITTTSTPINVDEIYEGHKDKKMPNIIDEGSIYQSI